MLAGSSPLLKEVRPVFRLWKAFVSGSLLQDCLIPFCQGLFCIGGNKNCAVFGLFSPAGDDSHYDQICRYALNAFVVPSALPANSASWIK